MNDPYSAYQDLMTALVTRRPDQSAAADDQVVQAALVKYAHELAEKIRRGTSDPLWDLSDEYYTKGVADAADLIDPEVKS